MYKRQPYTLLQPVRPPAQQQEKAPPRQLPHPLPSVPRTRVVPRRGWKIPCPPSDPRRSYPLAPEPTYNPSLSVPQEPPQTLIGSVEQIILRSVPAPVSYTHLDVYKRQHEIYIGNLKLFPLLKRPQQHAGVTLNADEIRLRMFLGQLHNKRCV